MFVLGVGKSFESVLKTNWNSHYHNYSLLQEDRTIKSDSKNLKNVEVETDLDVSAYEVRDNYGQGRQDQSIEFDFDQTLQHVDPFYIGPVKDSRNSLKKVIVIISDKREPPKQKRSVEFSTNNKEWKNENVKKSYRNIERLQENDWINYSNVNFKGKTVFQSFSLTTPSQWSAFQSNEHSSSLESNEVDEDLIKRTSNNILDAQEFVDKKTDGTSHLKFLSTLKSISDTREKNDEKTNKSFFNEKVVENVTQKPCEKPEVAKSNAWSIGVEEKTNQASARQVLCANWLHQILSPNLDKNKKSEPKKQTALLDVISQDSQTPAEETRDDQIERPSALKEVTRYDMMSSKSKFDESTYRITSMSPLFHEDFTQTSEYSIVEAISLEEALKRKKENMKYKFLNNRVVGGSSDVRYPTGADVSKPSINAFETLKTGQQLSFAPSAASQFVFPYQMCLFPNPDPGSKPSIRSSETRTFSLGTSPLFGSASEKDDTLKHLTRMPSQQNFISFNINNYANSPPRQQIHFPPSGTSTFTFPPYQTLLNNSPFPNTPPIFCTFLQPPLFQFPTLPGTADFSHAKCIDCEESVYQISSNREKLFSTSE